MTDPETVIGAGLAILGSKDLLARVLGPTADYLGGEARGLVQKCNVNLDQILKKAVRKLGKHLEQPGGVSPRVLKGVLDDGRFCEDELAAEYYGGILASSRSPDGSDDRAVGLLAVVRDLSSYQLRLHFVVYKAIRQLYTGKGLSLHLSKDRDRMRTFLPLVPLLDHLALAPAQDSSVVLSHAVAGLCRTDLAGSQFAMGDQAFLRDSFADAPGPGLVIAPTIFGAELFLWASGISSSPVRALLEAETPIEDALGSGIPPGCLAVTPA